MLAGEAPPSLSFPSFSLLCTPTEGAACGDESTEKAPALALHTPNRCQLGMGRIKGGIRRGGRQGPEASVRPFDSSSHAAPSFLWSVGYFFFHFFYEKEDPEGALLGLDWVGVRVGFILFCR